jgi:hypothetical protein
MTIKTKFGSQKTDETMNIDRRHLVLPAVAVADASRARWSPAPDRRPKAAQQRTQRARAPKIVRPLAISV